MIIYDLLCSCGCQFEGWFRDRDDFLEQQRSNIMHCPTCGNAEVHKILSPVAVQKSGSARRDPGAERHPEAKDETAPALALLKAVRQFVVSNFEDVGTRLAEESLKMHYGIEEHRNIRGVASEEEENTLKKEGIELLKIPFFAEEDKVN